jgi:hypothetical protein
MQGWIAFALGFAGVSAGLLLVARRTDARVARAAPDQVAPVEPCWVEAIADDGRYSYGRSHCVNDELMDMDARARRGDHPFQPYC